MQTALVTLDYLSLSVPLPTYILGPVSSEHAQYFEEVSPDGGEIGPNITCLGKKLLWMFYGV